MAQGLSVVLPVYNNAPVLGELCRRIREAVPDRELEIVMVDDASSDNSLAVMRELPVRVLAKRVNGGQNRAILAGLSQATQPLACVMDADLEDPPEAIPELVARLERGDVGVVFATRETRSPLTSRGFRWIMRRIFPSLRGVPCLFFAVSREARLALLMLARDGDYVVAALGALGLPTASVAVKRAQRPAGTSSYGTRKRVVYAASALISALRLRRRRA
ncbi:MAG TPA: glycosyltransferase [Polyangiaceae bacterium]|jgi:undecaprenyl-phosphate 4-deoxy-4-formamido-L-arabinose transferase|nr:glycosyltransferase [Polyangiaceae bacterium]